MSASLEVFWNIVPDNACFCAIVIIPKKAPRFQNFSFQLFSQAEAVIEKSCEK